MQTDSSNQNNFNLWFRFPLKDVLSDCLSIFLHKTRTFFSTSRNPKKKIHTRSLSRSEKQFHPENQSLRCVAEHAEAIQHTIFSEETCFAWFLSPAKALTWLVKQKPVTATRASGENLAIASLLVPSWGPGKCGWSRKCLHTIHTAVRSIMCQPRVQGRVGARRFRYF
jgi:hypothetical protein